jgi:hypothetical protein
VNLSHCPYYGEVLKHNSTSVELLFDQGDDIRSCTKAGKFEILSMARAENMELGSKLVLSTTPDWSKRNELQLMANRPSCC